MIFAGMGNRFRQLPGYHNIIRAHGIIAAITFLFIVPSAILVARFYTRNPRLGVRIHIWLQIITLLLITVVFTLGTFAVGPSRRLSNPHHGIGTAIFVLILVQFLFGWWMHQRLKKRKVTYEPLKATVSCTYGRESFDSELLMFQQLHHWLGRAIALLGLAQIPLGLTLYGSPLVLFVLYALAVFALLVTYFWLTRRRERDYPGSDYDSRYDYGTGSVVDERRRRSGSGWLKPVLAGAGIYAVVDRFRRRSGSRRDGAPHGPEVVDSHRHSESYLHDEKDSRYSRDGDRSARWEDRLLKIAAPLGLAFLVTRYFDRRYRDRDSDISEYGPPLGGATPINDGRFAGHRPPPSEAPLPPGAPLPPSQPLPPAPGPYGQTMPPSGGPIPLNQPLPSSHHPLNRTHSRGSSMTYSDYASASGEARKTHGLRDGLATLGVIGLAKSLFDRRRSRQEDRRLHEQEDLGVGGQHIASDGRPMRHHRHGLSSVSSNVSLTAPHPSNSLGIPPLPAGTYAGAGAVTAAEAERERERERRRQEALPLGGVYRPVDMPQIPPDPQGLFHPESTGSESYNSPGGRGHHRHHLGRDAAVAGAAGGAAGLAAAEASSSRHDKQERHQSTSAGEESGVTSPPVSVRVKMHKDGRHVTLSRLPEAEAEARRMRSARNRDDSASSLSGDGGGNRFRRRDAKERENTEAMQLESERLAAARNQSQTSNAPPPPQMNLPPPPPIPESSSGMRPPAGGSVGSPGNYETDVSTDYANNRRRRRAERAQAKQAKEEREARTGKVVGFE